MTATADPTRTARRTKKPSSPAFQIYVKEWRSSRSIARMSFAQRGMYFEMLLEQWDAGYVPDDPDECASLLGGRPADWRRSWSVLRRKFDTSAPGQIVNARLEVERVKQRKWQKKAQKGGINSTKTRNSSTNVPLKLASGGSVVQHSVSVPVPVSRSEDQDHRAGARESHGVLVKIAHGVIQSTESYIDAIEGIKGEAARARIAYDSTEVARAYEVAIRQRGES